MESGPGTAHVRVVLVGAHANASTRDLFSTLIVRANKSTSGFIWGDAVRLHVRAKITCTISALNMGEDSVSLILNTG